MQTEIARIVDVAKNAGDDAALKFAQELAEQLPRGELNLLVVGQFKRGKSTLVNALLGADVMPTGALPITGVVTAIRYGAIASIDVRLQRDPESRRVAVDELPLYVSERYNPGNILGVERVDVAWPSERIRGFALFDTPGVGSTFERNTVTARAALPRADAAILVVGPEPPIGAEELAYASEVLAASEELFVVLNKSDLAGEALRDILDFTRNAVSRILTEGKSADILPMSATRARDAQRERREDSAFGSFVETLRRFSRDRGDVTRERSARRRATAIVRRLEVLLAMRSEALNLPAAERQRRKTLVERALQSIDDRVRALELTVDDDARRLVSSLHGELDRWYDRETATFCAESTKLSKEPSSRRCEKLVASLLAEKARDWREDLIERASRDLCAECPKYARTLGELEVAAVRAGCEVLHVDAGALEAHQVEFAPAELELPMSLVPTTGLEVLLFVAIDLLPPPLRRTILRRRYERILANELDALRGKLRYGIGREVESWRRSTRATIASSVESTRRAVLGAFQELATDDDVAEEHTELERVRRLQRELSAVNAELNDHALAS